MTVIAAGFAMIMAANRFVCQSARRDFFISFAAPRRTAGMEKPTDEWAFSQFFFLARVTFRMNLQML
jgi:hypothetical protein